MTLAADAPRIVTFRLAGELFAAEIGTVERVLRYEPPRAIPGAPEWIPGVIEHQGKVVPVVDLRVRFGLPAERPGAQARLIVLTAAGEYVAAIVDAVLDVRRVEGDQLTAPPSLFRGLAGEFLRGLTQRDGELVVVLDAERLLTSQERLALEPALRPLPRG